MSTGGKEPLRAIGLLLALAAFVWHAVLMTAATNDNFMHMALAQQWLAGDWPVRDFFDQSSVLQYAVSAVAQAVGGDRLMSEAVAVGLAWALSTWIVFRVVSELTGSSVVAVLSSVLPLVAGARGYSYPKGIVYAVAAVLWWRYVRNATVANIALLGAWAAVAFYFRADHGVYVAISVVLAAWAAHGARPVTVVRSVIAGAMMAALVAPFLAFIHATVGLPEYIQTGVAAATVEHATQGPHAWPVLRFERPALVAVEPAETYAPTLAISWTPGSTPDDRRRVVERYGLTVVQADDDGVDRVKPSASTLSQLRALVNEPIVQDTGGIDRSTGTLSASWPRGDYLRFAFAPLRLRLLPDLDAEARAAELAVALFYLLPVVMILAAPWMWRYLPGAVGARSLAAFSVFALLVDAAMLRIPFTARMADAVVLSAIVFGCCVGAAWNAITSRRRTVEADLSGAAGGYRASRRSARRERGNVGVRARRFAARVLLGTAAVVLIFAVTTNVAAAGRFTGRLNGLMGEWSSFARAKEAWGTAYRELTSEPPLRYFVDARARFSVRLAAYVRACVPESDRLLVLWFEPEIYYYGDRLMAQRHIVFAPAWASVVHEQRMTMEKIDRYRPPIVLARRSALDGYGRASYPGVVEYVEREYQLGATVQDGGEEYLIYARRDRAVLRRFGPQQWPCFVAQASEWDRVGGSS